MYLYKHWTKASWEEESESLNTGWKGMVGLPSTLGAGGWLTSLVGCLYGGTGKKKMKKRIGNASASLFIELAYSQPTWEVAPSSTLAEARRKRKGRAARTSHTESVTYSGREDGFRSALWSAAKLGSENVRLVISSPVGLDDRQMWMGQEFSFLWRGV